MNCSHTSTKRKTQGQEDKCILCGIEIIYTHEDIWQSTISIPTDKVAKLLTRFQVDKYLADKLHD